MGVTVKTEDLVGKTLNYAVCIADGHDARLNFAGFTYYAQEHNGILKHPNYLSWLDGGPIIERDCIRLIPYKESEGLRDPDYWEACIMGQTRVMIGSSPLEAAMRCFVAYMLGDEIEITES